MRPEARRAALAFGLAGAAVAAVHVLTETPGAWRDWRQTLPLAALLGAGLGGAGFRTGRRGPGMRAAAGAGLAAVAVLAFAPLFAAGHGAIEAARGAAAPMEEAAAALGRSLRAAAGPTGLAALAAGALAGLAAGARDRHDSGRP